MINVKIVRRRKLQNGAESFRIRTYLGTVNGKPQARWETFRGTYAEATNRVAFLHLEASRGRVPVPGDMLTFGQLMERVYDMPAHHRRKGKAKEWTPAGKARVRSAIDCYFDPKDDGEWSSYLDPPGPKRIDKLDTAWWDGFYGRVTKRKLSGGPAAGGTVLRLHNIAHAAYEQARRWKLVFDNPLDDCTLPDSTRRRVSPPTLEELSLLFHRISAVDAAFYTFLYLAADLGERRGEGVALRWQDIDLDEGIIGVGARVSLGEDGPVLLQHTKARDFDSPRCSLSPETIALLGEHKAWLRGELAKFDLVQGPQSWVFPRIFEQRKNPLEPWRPDYVTKRFAKLRREVNLEHIRFHDLRHFVATEMLADGRDPVTVAARLRNNPTTVMNTYAHWRRQADQDAVAAHGRKLARLTQPRLELVE